MSQGGLLGLAEVVKGLQVLSELRPLPTKERELYDNARHLLVAELSAGLVIPEVDAEDSVDLVLFPPGRERPKRTAEEFRAPAGDDEGLELGEEMLGLGGDLEGAGEGEPEPAEGEAEVEEAEEEVAPAKAKPAPARAKPEKKAPAKAKPAAKAKPEKKAPAKAKPATKAKPAAKAKPKGKPARAAGKKK
jgi:CarD family transcriptional regulator